MEGGWKAHRARSIILTATSKRVQEPLRSTVNVRSGPKVPSGMWLEFTRRISLQVSYDVVGTIMEHSFML